MPEVLFEKKDKIAYITINRPEAHNALNWDAFNQVSEAWLRVRDDPDIWTAIVTGAGDRAFCAGADLKEVVERGVFLLPSPVSMRDYMVWKPFIAAINGFCLGGGLELALHCDLRIASEKATFGFPEVTVSLVPGLGGTQRLPQAIPLGPALEMLLTGDRISAQEAYRLGLVNKVVPHGEVMAAAEALAHRINKNGPLAVRAIKEAVYRGLSMPVADGLGLEALTSHVVQATEDGHEGLRSFMEKRPPQFKAR